MSIKIAVLMDPIETVDTGHDSSYLMMLAAQKRGCELFYFQQHQLYAEEGVVKTTAQTIRVSEGSDFYQLGELKTYALAEFDVVLMRKDPPFNMNYIYTTYLLELAQQQGCRVLNHPRSIRDCNEKLFTLWFKDACPATLITSQKKLVRDFQNVHGDIILKPIDGMGGAGVFLAKQGDVNLNSMIEQLTDNGKIPIVVQQYQPAIRTSGDKRIILINGEPISHALVRKPAENDIRGNMVAGASTTVEPLTDIDKQLCNVVGHILKEKGLLFVGLDVIGDKITEINVTSPTGAHEIMQACRVNAAEIFIEHIISTIITRS